jgi:hypothetical protein
VSARAVDIDVDAVLCVLILAPRTLPRNRYFFLFEDPEIKRVKRRAARVRGIIRQLTDKGPRNAEITGEAVLEDGRCVIRYRVPAVSASRTTALSALEAATLRYALHRAGKGDLDPRDRRLVERALSELGVGLDKASGAPARGNRS